MNSVKTLLTTLGLSVAIGGYAGQQVYWTGEVDNDWDTDTIKGNWKFYDQSTDTYRYTYDSTKHLKMESLFRADKVAFDEKFIEADYTVEFSKKSTKTTSEKVGIYAGTPEAPIQFMAVDSATNGISATANSLLAGTGSLPGYLRLLSGSYDFGNVYVAYGRLENNGANLKCSSLSFSSYGSYPEVPSCSLVQRGGSIVASQKIEMGIASVFTNFSGTVTTGMLQIGSHSNNASFVVLDGLVSVTNTSGVCMGAESRGDKKKTKLCELKLDGGVLETRTIQRINGITNNVVFNGGVLRYYGSDAVVQNFISKDVDIVVGARGGTFDTAGSKLGVGTFDVSNADDGVHTDFVSALGPEEEDGGLTFTGGGAVVLGRTHFGFTGPIRLTMGTFIEMRNQLAYVGAGNTTYPGKKGNKNIVFVFPDRTSSKMNGDYVVMRSKTAKFSASVLQNCRVENQPSNAKVAFSFRDYGEAGNEIVCSVEISGFVMSIR